MTITQARDALAKSVFAALFDTIVGRINAVSAGPASARSIGILDIFGFESFKRNSLEQLCQNLANERLQVNFMQTVIDSELNILKVECVDIG